MSRSGIVALSNVQQFAAINLLSDPGHIPGPIVIPGCMQIRLLWVQDSARIAVNVLHARYSGGFPGTIAMANSILTSLAGAYTGTGLADFAPTTSNLGGVDLRDLGVINQPIISSSAGGAPGTSSGAAQPNEVALVMTLRTALTSQANRGRIYQPNWATNALGAGNLVAAAAVTALTAFGADIRSIINATVPLIMVLAHPARAEYTSPRTGRLHPARPAGTVDVTAVIVRDNHWDTVRRRGLK